MYQLECKDNSGFEDIISNGWVYDVYEFKNNSVLICDDRGKERWLGDMHFCQPEYKD
jgi:hypothetical protein